MKPCPYCEWNDDHPYHYPDCPALEIAALLAELNDIKESFRNVVNGKCAGDERHCACVPPLRARLAALLAENEQGAKELSGLKRKVEDVEGIMAVMAKEEGGIVYPSQRSVARAVSAWLKEG